MTGPPDALDDRLMRPGIAADRDHYRLVLSRMPSGGHFAAAEEPELTARDIAAFFATLDR